MTFVERYVRARKDVVAEVDRALSSIDPEQVERLRDEILRAKQVFFVGVGRVMLALQGVCKRMSHLGIDAHCVGDVTEPAMTDEDLLIVASGSGRSLFPLGVAKRARAVASRAVIAHIGSATDSEMRDVADFMVRIPVRTKAHLPDEIESCQPMTTIFDQCVLLLGDVLAKTIVEERGLDMDVLWRLHANLE